MKILAVIAIILGMTAATGVVCAILVIAWLWFEETEIGQEITDKIMKRLRR